MVRNRPCGCCDDHELRTPEPRRNPPGQPSLRYRVGTHTSFLATMLADLPRVAADDDGDLRPLAALTERTPDDPAIALLDVWATLADVLTFYQERIANEGYLATATERRSLVELARLVGYRPRPGVAATVHLAFTVEGTSPLRLPAGTRVQSVPQPGQTAQTFETREDLLARAEWNALRPRRRRPLAPTPSELSTLDTLWLEGNHADLRPNAPLLLVLHEATPDQRVPRLRRVAEAEFVPGQPEGAALAPDRTRVRLQVPDPAVVQARAAREVRRILATAFGRRPEGATADELSERFEAVSEQLASDPGVALDELRGAVVPELRSRHAGMPTHFTTLRPWLGDTLDRIDRVLTQLPQPPAADSAANVAAIELRRDATAPEGDRPPLLAALLEPPSRPPPNAQALGRDVTAAFSDAGDAGLRLLTRIQPSLGTTLYPALRGLPAEPGELTVYALRQRAPLFGHNAARIPTYASPAPDGIEGPALTTVPNEGDVLLPPTQWNEWPLDQADDPATLHLDQAYDELASDGYAVVLRDGDDAPRIFSGVQVDTISRHAYGLAGRSTRLALPAGQAWYEQQEAQDLGLVRGTTVLAGSVALPLADAPIDTVVAKDTIELDALYDGLEAGRWLIVRGERDLPDTTVETSEVAMLAAVDQGVATAGPRADGQDGDDAPRTRPGESLHTTLRLAVPLAYRYRRDTVRVHANVPLADHGETVTEPLGSSDGRERLQHYVLSQRPVTHSPAPTPDGAEPSLEVRVNDVRWHPAPHLGALDPGERGYLTERDTDEVTTVTFGDGDEHGAIPPGGTENLTARYRVGLGRVGNVAGGSLSILKDRPLGAREVTNPLPATGGADPDTVEQTRRNVPLTLTALDRLVSLQDHADVAARFAGIGRADASRLPLGRRGTVFLTVAGHEDAPLDPGGELLGNLRAALRRFGDPRQPVRVAPRELVLLVLSANVKRHADHRWEDVEAALRAALAGAFGFERRDLAQAVHSSEVLAAMQAVRGVEWADLDVLAGVAEEDLTADPLGDLTPALLTDQPRRSVGALRARLDERGRPRPAQLLLLQPDLPDTVLLREMT